MQTTFNYIKGQPPKQRENCEGMTALVTGATGGIGFEVARALANTKARVLLLARKGEQAEEAISRIKEMADGPVDVTFVPCDLGNLAEVKCVGDRIVKDEKRLDIVVAGAGVGVNKFALSSDGIDRHFAVNHLGHFLLLNRLFPLIVRTSRMPDADPPRVIVISSELHRSASSDIQFASPEEITPNSEAERDKLPAHFLYARSKLANILFVKYGLFQHVIEPHRLGIYAIATHPGAIHTGMQDQLKEAYGGVLGTAIKALTVPFMRSPEQGSHSTLWAALGPDVINNGDGDGKKEKWQAAYVTDPGVEGKENSLACDEQRGQRLWELSEYIIREKLGKDALGNWVDE